MNITIELPESYRLYFGDSDIEYELKKNSALILYKQGRISLSKASELSEMDIYDFTAECKKIKSLHWNILQRKLTAN